MMSTGGYTAIGDDNNGTNVYGTVPAVVSAADHVALKFKESNLQTFPPSLDSQGKIPVFRLPSDADDTFSKPLRGSSDELQQAGWMHAFTVGAYKPYFDVDTANVLERIKDSLFPFRGTFADKTSDNPDLYGPFWICTTLVFVAAAIGTFVTYLAHKLQHKEWEYGINLVTWSAGLFYGYVTFVPLGLYIVLKYFSVPSGFVQLWCLFGYPYSFSFLPCSFYKQNHYHCRDDEFFEEWKSYYVMCFVNTLMYVSLQCLSIVPVEIFRWVIVCAAGLMFATFVALNLRTHIVSSGERWFLIVAGIFLLQLTLAVVLKLYFFTITV